ncbi:MAG: hypothetical protein VB061_05760 [Christensenella sp.]|nr:hypothetical protein [Christensenella sp.]
MEKKTVSDAAKAEAAKRAAAAKKAAQSKGSVTKSAPAKSAPKKAPVKAEKVDEVEEAVESSVDEAPASGGKGSVKGLRIGAIILWVLALAAEVGAFFAFSYAMRNQALTFADLEMQLLVGALILDAIFCIVAAQLWKKANRIRPNLSDSKLVRTLWHQLGVIMVLVCFLPVGIFLLAKSDKLNKKTKTILIALLAALFLGAGAASVDYQQPSEAQVQQMQEEAQAEAVGDVYWTKFGKSYHFDRNCPYIKDKTPAAEGGTLFAGSLDDAFAANRWDPCDTCAGGAQAKLDEAAAQPEG